MRAPEVLARGQLRRASRRSLRNSQPAATHRCQCQKGMGAQERAHERQACGVPLSRKVRWNA